MGKLLEPGFIDGVREKGEHLIGRLQKLQQRWPEHIAEIRGKGLIAGAVTGRPAADYLAAFRQRDILVATAGADVVRFLPPLVVERDRIDEAVDVFDEILRQGV